MKAATTTSILGLLFASALARVHIPSPVQETVEIEEGGVTFKVSRFTDGRSTPYRVYFWDEHLTGSSYRLSSEGHVEYFKAGDEVYYDRMEMDDESLTYLMKEKKRDRSTEKVDQPPEETLGTRGCSECRLVYDAVCGMGLPMFCDRVRRHSLGDDGADSVDILCDNLDGACATAEGYCDLVCSVEEGETPTCDNGFVGFQASNGACCAAGCGQCGGVGCSSFGKELGFDQYDCCATEIVDMGDPCSEAGKAPCYIDESGSHRSRKLTGKGSTDKECGRSSLTAEDLDGIDVYDLDMYIEPFCMKPFGPRPHGCNFMDLGMGCRRCFETCEGALYYMKTHKKEIKKGNEDAIMNFCPDSGLRSLADCRED
eukprot:g7557.t1